MQNHSDLFPQLYQLEEALVSKQQLLSMPYFKQAERFVQSKDMEACMNNMKKQLKKISVKKGTVLYFAGEQANRCYFLKRGCLQVLIRKNNKQKLQMFPNHNIASASEKVSFLFEKFGIQKVIGQRLIDQFYQEKVLFKYLNFRTLYGEGEVGVAQLLRNSFRVFTVVATSDSQLLVLDNQNFNKCLRQFQKKKQNNIIETILISYNNKILQQLKYKFGQVMLTSMIKLMDTDQILFRQNSSARFLYYVIEGQLQIVKTAQLEIPKKYQLNDDRKANPKQIELKIHKVGRFSFLGQQAIVSGRKQYNFTAKCSSNQTMVIRLEPISFIKALSENSQVQSDFKESKSKKIEMAVESFEKQLKKIRQAFQQQFQDVDNKKKQILISNFLKNDTYIKTRLFEVFNDDHGLFYRDTFEKLEILNQQSPTQIKSKAKPKIKGTGMMINSPTKQQVPQTEFKLDNDSKLTTTLNTPFRQTDFLIRSSMSLNRPSISSKKSGRLLQSIDKFCQIKKDQSTYKRVMIMQGRYEVDRKIDHSKNIKAIVNHNFDQIVKKAITRKNPTFRKAGEHRRQDLYRQCYQKVVQNLNKPKHSSAPKLWLVQSPCKGVEQMKKKMKKINTIREQQSARFTTNIKQNILQDCIGVNELPRNRSTNRIYAQTTNFSLKPEKIVLLNHMMKPMTYTSFQF